MPGPAKQIFKDGVRRLWNRRTESNASELGNSRKISTPSVTSVSLAVRTSRTQSPEALEAVDQEGSELRSGNSAGESVQQQATTEKDKPADPNGYFGTQTKSTVDTDSKHGGVTGQQVHPDPRNEPNGGFQHPSLKNSIEVQELPDRPSTSPVPNSPSNSNFNKGTQVDASRRSPNSSDFDISTQHAGNNTVGGGGTQPEHPSGDAQCENCEASATASDSTVSWCSICNVVLCNKCWPGQIAHRKNGHEKEKREPWLQNIMSSIFDPQDLADDECQNAIKRSKWFGRNRGQPYTNDRYGELLMTMELGHPHYPAFIGFVGDSGSGKSTIIKALLKMKSSDVNIQTPIIGSERSLTESDHIDVHLFADPSTRESRSPYLYLDCEGSSASSANRLEPQTTSQRERGKQKRPAQGGIHPNDLCTNTFLSFSDVIVYVTRNPRTIEKILIKLIRHAAEKKERGPVRPFAIIIFNAVEDNTPVGEDPPMFRDSLTKETMDRLAETITADPDIDSLLAQWEEEDKTDKTFENFISRYYSGIRIICLPHTNTGPSRILSQYQTLELEIKKAVTRILCLKTSAKVLRNDYELDSHFESVFDHFITHPSEPLDLLEAIFARNPVQQTFQRNISRTAECLMEIETNKSSITTRLAPFVASSIILDVCRKGYPQGVNTAKKVFAKYESSCREAIEEDQEFNQLVLQSYEAQLKALIDGVTTVQAQLVAGQGAPETLVNSKSQSGANSTGHSTTGAHVKVETVCQADSSTSEARKLQTPSVRSSHSDGSGQNDRSSIVGVHGSIPGRRSMDTGTNVSNNDVDQLGRNAANEGLNAADDAPARDHSTEVGVPNRPGIGQRDDTGPDSYLGNKTLHAAVKNQRNVLNDPQFAAVWGHSSTKAAPYNTCFCCLGPCPSYILPCKHIICGICIEEQSVPDGELLAIGCCPLCQHGSKLELSVRKKTPELGPRVLILDGIVQSSETTNDFLPGLKLPEIFDLIVGTRADVIQRILGCEGAIQPDTIVSLPMEDRSSGIPETPKLHASDATMELTQNSSKTLNQKAPNVFSVTRYNCARETGLARSVIQKSTSLEVWVAARLIPVDGMVSIASGIYNQTTRRSQPFDNLLQIVEYELNARWPGHATPRIFLSNEAEAPHQQSPWVTRLRQRGVGLIPIRAVRKKLEGKGMPCSGSQLNKTKNDQGFVVEIEQHQHYKFPYKCCGLARSNRDSNTSPDVSDNIATLGVDFELQLLASLFYFKATKFNTDRTKTENQFGCEGQLFCTETHVSLLEKFTPLRIQIVQGRDRVPKDCSKVEHLPFQINFCTNSLEDPIYIYLVGPGPETHALINGFPSSLAQLQRLARRHQGPFSNPREWNTEAEVTGERNAGMAPSREKNCEDQLGTTGDSSTVPSGLSGEGLGMSRDVIGYSNE